jgi:hypothetical protein
MYETQVSVMERDHPKPLGADAKVEACVLERTGGIVVPEPVLEEPKTQAEKEKGISVPFTDNVKMACIYSLGFQDSFIVPHDQKSVKRNFTPEGASLELVRCLAGKGWVDTKDPIQDIFGFKPGSPLTVEERRKVLLECKFDDSDALQRKYDSGPH